MSGNIFEKARWIWTEERYAKHEYADFIAEFDACAGGGTLRICAKTDYAVWLNGRLVGFNQYHDFPDRKVYDEYSLAGFIRAGKNRLAVLSVAFNSPTFSRFADGKGIIFEVTQHGRTICVSDTKVLSKPDGCYLSGEKKYVTVQLGYSFFYDFRGERDWRTESSEGFSPSLLCEGGKNFVPRPVEKLSILPCRKARRREGTEGLYDLGREMVGYLSFEAEAAGECELRVSYGEHIADGGVRRLIHDRDFSAVFRLKKGLNRFDEYFLRFGLRYLQFDFPAGTVSIRFAGIRESVYPLTPLPVRLTGRDRQIYEVSVATLQNCMHEHYEDSPWREQAQYCMDGRSELLCTYLAFGDTRFPRAALVLMAHRLTADGLLPMTSPSQRNQSITSFNFVYFLALREYLDYSGDMTILEEVGENCRKVIDGFVGRLRDGLLYQQPCWNFVEWSDGLEDSGYFSRDEARLRTCCFANNAWMMVALENYAEILRRQGKDFSAYLSVREKIGEKLRSFRDAESGLYYTFLGDGKYFHLAEYTQYIALYAGVAENADELIEKTSSRADLVKMSLASYIFRCEVLVKREKYRDLALCELREKFGRMLDAGATAFWETELGEADFGGAGSLCHGWSSLPIYVYHALRMV